MYVSIPHSYVSKISNKTVLERSGRQEISNILTYPRFVFWGKVPILLVIDVRKQCMFSGRIFQPRIVEQQQRRGHPKKFLGVQDVLTCKRCGTGAGLDKALLTWNSWNGLARSLRFAQREYSVRVPCAQVSLTRSFDMNRITYLSVVVGGDVRKCNFHFSKCLLSTLSVSHSLTPSQNCKPPGSGLTFYHPSPPKKKE